MAGSLFSGIRDELRAAQQRAEEGGDDHAGQHQHEHRRCLIHPREQVGDRHAEQTEGEGDDLEFERRSSTAGSRALRRNPTPRRRRGRQG